jgi:hypothetical protein
VPVRRLGGQNAITKIAESYAIHLKAGDAGTARTRGISIQRTGEIGECVATVGQAKAKRISTTHAGVYEKPAGIQCRRNEQRASCSGGGYRNLIIGINTADVAAMV